MFPELERSNKSDLRYQGAKGKMWMSNDDGVDAGPLNLNYFIKEKEQGFCNFPCRWVFGTFPSRVRRSILEYYLVGREA